MITLTGTRRTLGKITWQKSTSLWRTSHEKPALRNIALSELLSQNEVLMKRLPSNLSADDLRIYRRWTGGLYLSYLAAIIVAIALTFANRPATELRASNEIRMARLNGSSTSIDGPAAAKPVTKP
jgi:hypothetical protein